MSERQDRLLGKCGEQIERLGESLRRMEDKGTKRAKKVTGQLKRLGEMVPRVEAVEKSNTTQGDFLDAQVRSIKEEILGFQARVDQQLVRHWEEIQKCKVVTSEEPQRATFLSVPSQVGGDRPGAPSKGVRSLKKRGQLGSDSEFDAESVFASKATREAFKVCGTDK